MTQVLSDSVYGARIHRARQAKGLSLKTVGAAAGLGWLVLSRLETGERQFRLAEAVAICAAVDLPIVDLVAPSHPPLVWTSDAVERQPGGAS